MDSPSLCLKIKTKCLFLSVCFSKIPVVEICAGMLEQNSLVSTRTSDQILSSLSGLKHCEPPSFTEGQLTQHDWALTLELAFLSGLANEATLRHRNQCLSLYP